MNLPDTAILLAKCAQYDQRTIGEADVAGWAEALECPWVPRITLDEAIAAVVAHYRRTHDRITVADVIREVRDERAHAAARAHPPAASGTPPPAVYRAKRQELNAHIAATRTTPRGAGAAREQSREYRASRAEGEGA